MIGIVVPAHNEELYLDACLSSLAVASMHPLLNSEEVQIHIVLDDCSDGSERIVQGHIENCVGRAQRVTYSHVIARNVGIARSTGASVMLDAGARWLSFTDADTIVDPEWIACQLNLNVDVVCGVVAVDDWSMHAEYADLLKNHFSHTYNDANGHHHIHGANLGISAQVYVRAGGFAPLSCHEDVALVTALKESGATFAWSAAPRVTTSARVDPRAKGGFGDTMLSIVSEHRANKNNGL